nr:redoxin domain-containing protein [Exiguobacterium sp. Leaf196]
MRAQRATVIAISPETADFAEQMANKNALSFPVLSDVDLHVSRQFDLVFDLPDYLIEIYKASGLDVAKHNGNEDWQLPKLATFIIDTNGVIRFVEVPSDYTKRVDPEHILQNLEQNKKYED